MTAAPTRLSSEVVFARIDAWWNEWIAALDSLTEDEQEIPGVCGKWSIRELMSHVDGWDVHAALVAERAAAGLPMDVPELRGTNKRSTERYAGLSVPESRAMMEATHHDLMHRLRAIGSIQAKWVAEDTYRHYPDHVDHVLEWRSQRAGARDAGMSNIEIAVAIDRSWKSWVETLAGIPEELRDERGVCGTWSVKDLIGHIAEWDRRSLEYAYRTRRNEPNQTGIDWTAINRETAAANRARSYDDLLAEMNATHESLVNGVLAMPGLEAEWIADGTYEHYPQHLAQIRAWKSWRY